MTIADVAYQKLVKRILKEGFTYMDERRGVERIQIPSATIEWKRDLEPILPVHGAGKNDKPMPVLTLKEMNWKAITTELLWFLRGDSSIYYLHKHDIHIWDKDAEAYWSKLVDDDPDKGKSLGRIYGQQWRDFGGYGNLSGDQIYGLISSLTSWYPMDTRHLVTAWNPMDRGEWALPPCHWAFEVLVEPHGEYYGFTIKWHQRSVDVFLGLPFNIASYALLGYILEGMTGFRFLGIIGDLSNVHIYKPHLGQTKEIAKRRSEYYAPLLRIESKELLSSVKDCLRDGKIGLDKFIEKLNPEDFKLAYYNNCGKLPAEMIAPKKA
nr:MAG TPA: Thymidylate synthase [Caudoviricetes sp.]